MAVTRAERRGDALWVTFDAPERRNAFDVQMATEAAEAIEGATQVRAVVITGAPGAFCAGGSLATLSTPTTTEMRGLFRASLRLVDAIRQCPRPVIAAVNGAAAGGGNEIVVACDLAIAAASATFGQTGTKVGSAPVMGATNLLAVQIGEKRSKEMSFLCRRYSAEEAFRLGLVNDVVDDDRLVDAVDDVVAELATLSPRYLEIAKVNSNVWWNHSRDSVLNGLGMLSQAVGSDDMVEGATAFLEKRRPVFAEPE
jgi:2-ketocyclohexanecarboxyl-CoA hydrolase